MAFDNRDMHKKLKQSRRRQWMVIFVIVLVACAIGGAFVWDYKRSAQNNTIVQEFLLIKDDAQKNRDALVAFYEKYPSHAMGLQALIGVLPVLIREEKTDLVLSLLQRAIPTTRKHMLLQAKFRFILASLYMSQSQWEKALEELVFLENLPDNPQLLHVRLYKAQVLHAMGKTTESQQLLKEIERFPSQEFSFAYFSPNDPSFVASLLGAYWAQ